MIITCHARIDWTTVGNPVLYADFFHMDVYFSPRTIHETRFYVFLVNDGVGGLLNLLVGGRLTGCAGWHRAGIFQSGSYHDERAAMRLHFAVFIYQGVRATATLWCCAGLSHGVFADQPLRGNMRRWLWLQRLGIR